MWSKIRYYGLISRHYQSRNWNQSLLQEILLVFSGKGILNLQSGCSVQFNHSVVSDSLQPHEPQHTRLSCLSPTPRVYSNSCPSSRWCHPAISSSVVPFSSCPQSLPASGSFPMSQLFTWGGQSTEFQLQLESFQWTSRTDLL